MASKRLYKIGQFFDEVQSRTAFGFEKHQLRNQRRRESGDRRQDRCGQELDHPGHLPNLRAGSGLSLPNRRVRCPANGTALPEAEHLCDSADSVLVQGDHQEEFGPLRSQI